MRHEVARDPVVWVVEKDFHILGGAGTSSRGDLRERCGQPAIRASYAFDLPDTRYPESALIVLYRTDMGSFRYQGPSLASQSLRFNGLGGITRRLRRVLRYSLAFVPLVPLRYTPFR